MPFAEYRTKPEILEQGQGSISQVAVERHPSGERFLARTNAIALDHVVESAPNIFNHQICQAGFVLKIRMDFNGNIRALVEEYAKEFFEIASIVQIALVPDNPKPKAPGHFIGSVSAAVISHNNVWL